MLCQLDQDGFCAIHKRQHKGSEAELALQADLIGETYRRLWTIQQRPRTPSLSVVMTSKGIGDTLLLLAVTAGIKEWLGAELTLGVPSSNLPWAEFWPSAYDRLVHNHELAEEEDNFYPYDSYPLELHEQSRLPRWEYYASFLGPFQCPPHLPSVELKQEDLDWARKFRGSVVFASYAQWHSRNWLLPNWIHLEDELIKKGYPVVILDTDARRCRQFRGFPVIGETPGRVLALLKTAALTICHDSGVGHMAGLAGGKALVLCGPTFGPKIFGLYPSLTCLQGTLPCSTEGCYWRGRYFTRTCSGVCAALQGISYQTVADLVVKLAS